MHVRCSRGKTSLSIHSFDSTLLLLSDCISVQEITDVTPGCCPYVNNGSGNSDWQLIYPNQHVSLEVLSTTTPRDHKTVRKQPRRWCSVSSPRGMIENLLSVSACSLWVWLLSPWWTLQVHRGIGSVCVILCMSKQIPVTSSSFERVQYAAWGMIGPTLYL